MFKIEIVDNETGAELAGTTFDTEAQCDSWASTNWPPSDFYHSVKTDLSTDPMSVMRERIARRIKEGSYVDKLIESVTHYVIGFNGERDINVTTFMQIISPVFVMLNNYQYSSAYALLNQVPVDGFLVTQELKDDVVFLFQQSGLPL